jgi:hypothetical protein
LLQTSCSILSQQNPVLALKTVKTAAFRFPVFVVIGYRSLLENFCFFSLYLLPSFLFISPLTFPRPYVFLSGWLAGWRAG